MTDDLRLIGAAFSRIARSLDTVALRLQASNEHLAKINDEISAIVSAITWIGIVLSGSVLGFIFWCWKHGLLP